MYYDATVQLYLIPMRLLNLFVIDAHLISNGDGERDNL